MILNLRNQTEQLPSLVDKGLICFYLEIRDMAYVQIKLPDLSLEEKTNLIAAESDGDTSINVRSTNGFVANDYIVVGEPGHELTECVKISSVTDDHNLALSSALLHDHPNGTIVKRTPWNQYSLEYRATSGGSFSAIAGMPLDLQWDDYTVNYNHTASTSSGAYKLRYYNSTSTTYSSYSGIINATGYTSSAVGYMVKKIRKATGDPDGQIVSDDEIIRFLNDGQDKIAALDTAWYFLLTEDNSTVTTTAGTREYNFPSDFGRLEALRFRYISTTSTSTTTTA